MRDDNTRDGIRRRVIQKTLARKRADVATVEEQLTLIHNEIEALENELDQLVDFVQVVYVKRTWIGELQKRDTWEYVDGTAAGLSVGDTVVAPTRYGDQTAVVVALTRSSDPYTGRLQTITRVINGAP